VCVGFRYGWGSPREIELVHECMHMMMRRMHACHVHLQVKESSGMSKLRLPSSFT
jgi:hypothetical protein